ncbi:MULTISPECIES: SDR family oxidoreductase [Ignavibacterium]|jgi:serine 3-dehydrogenase|uniref:SDR family oxidoreductase n=1 Tax=Ignavibacterium TaxID=795750 RepID=UPI0025C1477D|nr:MULTISPECIES: SDR family oxidoreductase [Ignavibacterium]
MATLEGKIVLITGASSGIGKSCAEKFAELNAKLILTARRKDRIENLAEELKHKFRAEILPLKLDVRNFEEVKSFYESLPAEWKKIDILVNNAGLARGFDKFYEGKIDDWNEMIDTNIKGLLYVSRVVVPQMVERESGHIINIGSTAGHEPYPMGNVYVATKFAVKALSQSFRIDVLEKGIKVTSIDPGMVETEFSKVRFRGDEERAKKVYDGLQPLTPDDVADAVIYAATRPKHVNINQIILTPLAQASSNFVHRKK